jgi:lipopolysaccharide/colanic/teichoic acid biosynthesis glycosyltransferase
MVHEDFVERPYRGSLVESDRRTSGPTVLVSAPAGESGAERPGASPILEELNRMAAAAALGEGGHLRPWQAVARAKGRPGYFLAKRVLDSSLAVLGLLLLSPLLLVVALLIRLTSKGPVFFRQERVGFGGRHFKMYKFRSMYVNSDDRLHRQAYEQFLRGERASGKVDGALVVAEQTKEGVPLDATHLPKHKGSGVPRDPRITPLGYLLRRSSIDELPQLLNVLRGEMSLVGPRPPIPYEVGLYQSWHLKRLDTLPGITGLWQVRGRSRVTFDQMVQMDIEYINQQSFWYDVKLIALTIPAVLSRKGAY